MTKDPYEIIKGFLATEKSNKQKNCDFNNRQKYNTSVVKYTLIVDINANKYDIRSVFIKAFGEGAKDLEVLSINTSILKGKEKRRGGTKKGAITYRKKDVKKAIVTVNQGLNSIENLWGNNA